MTATANSMRSLWQIIRAAQGVRGVATAVLVSLAIGMQGCAATPEQETGGLVEQIFDPAGTLHAIDSRSAFREVFCAINEARGPSLPDYRPCEDTLRHILPEPLIRRGNVETLPAISPFTILVVPGLSYDCFANLIGGDRELLTFAESLGHTVHIAPIKGLGDTGENARIIRDSILQLRTGAGRLVIFGYSKGTIDVLAGLADYPDIAERVDAVVGISSVIGGSALAENMDLQTLSLLTRIPGSECDAPTANTLESLSPEFRRQWLAENPLPQSVAYFSIVSFPEPERISTVLRPSFKKLAEIDDRNDGQVIVTDQVIPGSQVLAFVNADHWAVAIPVARSHAIAASTIVNHNDFPREVLLEAILRFVDAELAGP